MKSRHFTVLLLILTAAAYHWQGPCRGWLLRPEEFSATDIQEKAGKLLFRQGSLPDTVAAAAQKLLLQKSLREHRLADTMFHADVTEAAAQEMHSWRRQWEQDEERQQRLHWQRLDENGMEKAIQEALLDQAWIEIQISNEIQLHETELKAAFASQQAHLRIPEVSHVAHLFLSGHQPNQKDRTSQIASIRQRLDTGEKWAALVKKYSEDPRTKNQGGELGWLTDIRTPPEFMAVAHRMKAGDISPPVKTDLGWHIIRVLEKQQARHPRIEDVRLELTASLADQKRTAAIDRLVRRLLHRHPGPAL